MQIDLLHLRAALLHLYKTMTCDVVWGTAVRKISVAGGSVGEQFS